MPHRRPRSRGSFGSHFDELVIQFTDQPPSRENERRLKRSSKLQEKLDIHALLFEHAWRIDENRD